MMFELDNPDLTLVDRSTDITLPRIICAKELHSTIRRATFNHPSGAVVCRTSGNYGSALFDAEPGYIEFNICDDCLAARAERTLYVERRQPQPELSYSTWKEDNEAVIGYLQGAACRDTVIGKVLDNASD